jgi:CRISPR-associated protein Csy2
LDRQFIVIPHIRVTGANALNSLYSAGFPAMTAFLGFGHTLERNIHGLQVTGVGVVVHQSEFQAVRDGYSRTWALKAKKFPLVKARSQSYPGEAVSDSFQVRAYVDLDVSLIFECSDIPTDARDSVMKSIEENLYRTRLAGGDITSFRKPKAFFCSSDDDVCWQEQNALCRKMMRSIMPGFALVERRDIMDSLAKDGKGDALDRIMYATSADAIPEQGSKEKTAYRFERHFKGWLLPLAVGFHDLSGSVTVKGQRSYDAEHHFAEPLLTLCEFRMPHRFESVDNILWHYKYDAGQHSYLCVNSDFHTEKE